MLGQNTDLVHEATLTVDGKEIDISTVEVVEFSFGDLKKLYPSDSVSYENGVFLIHLTQEETQEFGSSITVQVRVKFNDGNIPLTRKKVLPVVESLSKEIL